MKMENGQNQVYHTVENYHYTERTGVIDFTCYMVSKFGLLAVRAV